MSIPQDRTLYLELAKLKPTDRSWIFHNLAQVKRILAKEMALNVSPSNAG